MYAPIEGWLVNPLDKALAARPAVEVVYADDTDVYSDGELIALTELDGELDLDAEREAMFQASLERGFTLWS